MLPLLAAAVALASPWVPDRGDGTYRNPVLFADYSDPDAIRVGTDFYLVSSSFHAVPGLPVLHSKDLVNWTLIGHALPIQPPAEYFSAVHHGEGVWAPALRFHDGKFVIYYPDPDRGIFRVEAAAAAGPWSAPLLVEGGRGLIDPCPFWEDDGTGYLIHGWARSRAGISNLLTLQPLAADGRSVRGPGRTIIDANLLPGWQTLEGPKLYKHDGYYYVFAPAGGVPTGYQAVFRSRSPWGPYEHRVVLEQGRTRINGPHQGAWVSTPAGEDWFLHFSDRGPYGRVVCLEPMRWSDGWPLLGEAVRGGASEPVSVYLKPRVGRVGPRAEPATTDEFSDGNPGLQWQWNANPAADWIAPRRGPSGLRLRTVPASPESRYNSPNFLLQKFPAPAFTAVTSLRLAPAEPGQTAGLVVFGYDYAILQVAARAEGTVLELVVNHAANKGGREKTVAKAALAADRVWLKVTVEEPVRCRFSYSVDGRKFLSLGEPFTATVDRWVGARVGLIATSPPESAHPGYADVDWFRVTN